MFLDTQTQLCDSIWDHNLDAKKPGSRPALASLELTVVMEMALFCIPQHESH